MGPEGSGCCAYFVMIVRARVIVCSIAVCPCTSEDPEPQGLPHDVSPAIIRFFGNEDDGSSRTAMAQTEHAVVSVLRREQDFEQTRAFTLWANSYLVQRSNKIDSLAGRGPSALPLVAPATHRFAAQWALTRAPPAAITQMICGAGQS